MSRDCGCLRCTTKRMERSGAAQLNYVMGIPVERVRMFFCEKCGNKRCPHSDDHRNPCTGSNESGQKGSRYA